MRLPRHGLFFASLLFALLTSGCRSSPSSSLILATTTSTQDSGLLDVLVPAFEQASGYRVQTVAVGTGQALKMGQNGDADVLLVHAPTAEEAFMDAGYGADRRLVMYNDFVLVGPATDPAAVRSQTDACAAFKSIASARALFVSRGDDSGTHKKERALWKCAGLTPAAEAYIESGQGMAATLLIASEKGAYTLTDRATYLANRQNLHLVILLEGDPHLLNIYHVITVNPQRWPQVNAEGARAFADFLTSQEGQSLIGEFGIERFGQPLFTPAAGMDENDLGQP
ncbi:MAG: tungsten ABC transporter substrate-binding protein [Anaerolineae bacterium]|nr:MAG: tungsten ABC transporter substrate-binding protein [Anaerolineae bacterium]